MPSNKKHEEVQSLPGCLDSGLRVGRAALRNKDSSANKSIIIYLGDGFVKI